MDAWHMKRTRAASGVDLPDIFSRATAENIVESMWTGEDCFTHHPGLISGQYEDCCLQCGAYLLLNVF